MSKKINQKYENFSFQSDGTILFFLMKWCNKFRLKNFKKHSRNFEFVKNDEKKMLALFENDIKSTKSSKYLPHGNRGIL